MIFDEKCMKIKEIESRGRRASLSPPPPMRQLNLCNATTFTTAFLTRNILKGYEQNSKKNSYLTIVCFSKFNGSIDTVILLRSYSFQKSVLQNSYCLLSLRVIENINEIFLNIEKEFRSLLFNETAM